jgi:CheY-like chemotaxis protein
MQPTSCDILLVDDDPAIRASFAEALEEEGFQVATAAHGQEALCYLRSMPTPRLIVLDLMMPVLDGWGFLNEQRDDPALRSIPVVVLSAHILSEREAAMLDVALYLRKPIKMLSLLMIVESYCRIDDIAREAEA